jgi:hypothetical protein
MYVKLFSTILTSSVWAQDHATRLVWITILAMADKEGDVRGSVSGLARMANVSLDEARHALDVLSSPDPESQTPDEQGRRIVAQQGGWHIVNYAKYRAIQDEATRKDAWRKASAKYRKRHNSSYGGDDASMTQMTTTHSSTEAEAEAEAEADTEAKSLATHTPALSFADQSHQSAYLATLANAKHPVAIDATIRATINGMHGTAYPPAIVGSALLELQAAGSTFSATGLRAFCRRLAAGDYAAVNIASTPVNTCRDISTEAEELNYSADFEKAWKFYPPRSGSNPKVKAWRAWQARIAEGVDPAAMIAGVDRYASLIDITGQESRFVMQAATFFGPDHRYADEYPIPPEFQMSKQRLRDLGLDPEYDGTTLTPEQAAYEAAARAKWMPK